MPPPPVRPQNFTAHSSGKKEKEKSPTNNVVASQLTSSETLLSLRKSLSAGLKQYPDFPQPGILFEDIFPLFADVQLHRDLIQAFVLTVQQSILSQSGINKPDVVIGLDARGFLIGPQLALALNAGFVPVRKPGKLPGKLETVEYKKEYGTDSFAIQRDSVKPGSKVLIVDDLIATGGSAAAAEALVEKCGGQTLGHVFLIELTKLNGRSKLKAPVFTVLESQAD
jgi:adenine phosphoribosyltransferase